MDLKDFIKKDPLAYRGRIDGRFSISETFEKLRKRNFSLCDIILGSRLSPATTSLEFSDKVQEYHIGVIRKKLILRQVRTRTKTKTALLRWIPENMGEFEGFTLKLSFSDRRSGTFQLLFSHDRLKLWEYQLA